jgi:hypothetical protein
VLVLVLVLLLVVVLRSEQLQRRDPCLLVHVLPAFCQAQQLMRPLA